MEQGAEKGPDARRRPNMKLRLGRRWPLIGALPLRYNPAMTTQLASKRHAVEDLNHAIEFCYKQGWTDGLPVVPPTEPAVRAMLASASLEPDKQVAFITHRQVAVSAEKIAVNAVMAGC